LLPAAKGISPRRDGEIGLGASTMHAAGVQLGSDVVVTVASPSGRERSALLRVVGQISFPVLGGAVGLGDGAAITIAGYERIACGGEAGEARCRASVFSGKTSGGVLASVVPGERGRAAVNRYERSSQADVVLPVTPISLVNFGEAVNFPLIFGVMLAIFGVATLSHLLLVSVSRRRREIGLLKVLGFAKHQIASVVAWQATTLAVVGVVIGMPLGVVLGRAVWAAFASNLGVIPVSVVPARRLAILVAAVMIAANLIAIAPALVATRWRPEELLRPR